MARKSHNSGTIPAGFVERIVKSVAKPRSGLKVEDFAILVPATIEAALKRWPGLSEADIVAKAVAGYVIDWQGLYRESADSKWTVEDAIRSWDAWTPGQKPAVKVVEVPAAVIMREADGATEAVARMVKKGNPTAVVKFVRKDGTTLTLQ